MTEHQSYLATRLEELQKTHPERFIPSPEDEINKLLKAFGGYRKFPVHKAHLIYRSWMSGATKLERRPLRNGGETYVYFSNRPDDVPNIGQLRKLNFSLAFSIYMSQKDRFYKNLKLEDNDPEKIHYLIGVPSAGDGIAEYLSEIVRIPFLKIDKRPADNPSFTPKIDGEFKPGANVLLVENALTSGKSILQCSVDTEAHDLNVVGVGIGLVRNSFGEKMLKAGQLPYSFGITLPELLKGGRVLGVEELQGNGYRRISNFEIRQEKKLEAKLNV